MYCTKCGKELGSEYEYCDKCGTKAGSAVLPRLPQTAHYNEKSAGLAALLSFLWGGLGQIYVGQLVRGLCIVVIYSILMMVTSVLVLEVLVGESSWPGVAGIIVTGISSIVIWLWNIFDANALANKYNYHVIRHGKPPW
ncbi:MAG: zinc ribbon domain-containing protein [Methanomassiliicoccaceae archaeon]|jgi:TM2 domain-containing membrane protein YozV|nr:zinc ribbon domain-containing protein [Methanomassiliicoccaceae archaeon]